MHTLKIRIDDKEIEGNEGMTILQAAEKAGISIPTLCHHRDLIPTGACRICVVEVEGAKTLMASCATPAADSMIVHTESPRVVEARKTIIQLLLSSGNHNCAIAKKGFGQWTEFQQQVESYDQSIELCSAHSACKLQAYAYRYQVDTSGLATIESPYAMETASPLIVRDFSRCIQCGRCVQACNDIQVNNVMRVARPDGPGYQWLAYDGPQVVVRFHDGYTGRLVYAESIPLADFK